MKYIPYIINILLIISVIFWLRGCGSGSKTEHPEKVPYNPDSLSKAAKVIDKALVADKAKEVKSDSVHKKETRKVLEVLQSAETIPWDTFKVEILKEVPVLIAVDSTEIANLRRVNCDLEAKVNNLIAAHTNDSTTIKDLRKQVKKRFWKGFKIGFWTGNVTGASVSFLLKK